jgi:extracellular elastinolytic metalloproteinase
VLTELYISSIFLFFIDKPGIMKKLITLFLVLLCSQVTRAQFNDAEKALAWQLVLDNKAPAGLSPTDLNNSRISDTYSYQESGKEFRVVYLQQTYRGVPVHNQIQVLAFRDNTFLSKSGDRIAGMEKRASGKSEIPAVSAYSAVQTALADRGLFPSGMSFPLSSRDNGKFIEFGNMNVSREHITSELMWVPGEKDQPVNLAWQVYVVPLNSSDYWQIRIDAANNTVLGMNNLTVYDNMDNNRYFNPFSWYNIQTTTQANAGTGQLKVANCQLSIANSSLSPSLVNTANYRVVAYPAEAPSFPGGAPSLVTNPWINAPGNATSLKWHNDGTLDYTITRGNNVWAKEDRAGTNSNTGSPDTSTTTPDPLNFDFTPNFTVDPTQRVPVPNQQFNTANLFYWNNIMHDVSYLYSFNEVSGNFQASNQGRGGLGNDFVYGDVQDGSGFNNANFSTPADGGNGRMQMFLWSSPINFNVNSPAAIAGSYGAIESGFSTANKLINVGPVTGQVIYYNDDAGGTTHLACGVPANTLTGKIAMINRGTCAFTVKVKNAQNAGAIAAIVVNNTTGTITMGGTDNTITIPAISITQADGATIAAQLANNVNVTMSANAQLDGDVDNGVICHEYGHGISNRLTGGPSNSGCLNNAEQMGEGISDYFALMLTQNWATSNLNTGFNTPRSMGTYVFGQPTTGPGIRSQKYCTNMAVNNLV